MFRNALRSHSTDGIDTCPLAFDVVIAAEMNGKTVKIVPSTICQEPPCLVHVSPNVVDEYLLRDGNAKFKICNTNCGRARQNITRIKHAFVICCRRFARLLGILLQIDFRASKVSRSECLSFTLPKNAVPPLSSVTLPLLPSFNTGETTRSTRHTIPASEAPIIVTDIKISGSIKEHVTSELGATRQMPPTSAEAPAATRRNCPAG